MNDIDEISALIGAARNCDDHDCAVMYAARARMLLTGVQERVTQLGPNLASVEKELARRAGK